MNKTKQIQTTLPELALIGGTRVLIGGGLGLLFSNRLKEEQRTAVGWTLLLVGAAVTPLLAFAVLGRRRMMVERDHIPLFLEGKDPLPQAA
jgi:hypothetical protein